MTTTPRVILADDILAAWMQAYRLILESGNRFNLTLHVANPVAIDPRDLLDFDPQRVDSGVDRLRDVATTIFPSRSQVWDSDAADLRAHYIPMYNKMLTRGRRSWGCYFLRMVGFGHERIDQLERVVGGLGGWGTRHKAAFVMHFSSADTERPKPLGAPCLQYVQFLVDDDERLSMTAVYRSHDYFRKTLGNLVGLARLLEFVALKTKHEIGTLTCHSTYAFIDISRKKANALLPAQEA